MYIYIYIFILTPGGVLGGSGGAEPPPGKLYPTPDCPDSYVFPKVSVFLFDLHDVPKVGPT